MIKLLVLKWRIFREKKRLYKTIMSMSQGETELAFRLIKYVKENINK